MATGNPLGGFKRAMRHRNYRLYTMGSAFSLIGTWTHKVAQGWLTWELTQSYAWLGIISFADLFTLMLVAPVAGAYADRIDRLRLARWSQLAMMGQALTVAVLVLTGWIDIWILLALTVALGAMHAFHSAARLAMVPNLVPHEDLTPAIALNSIIFQTARFVGPGIAGLIIVYLGVGPAFAFNSLTFIVFAWVLTRIRMIRIEHQSGPGKGIMSNIGEGLRYATGHPGLGLLLALLAITAFTARALPDLLPGFADGVFGRGPQGLAWMTAMMGFGSMMSGLYFLTRQSISGVTMIVLSATAGVGITAAAFAASPYFWLAVGVLILVGFFTTVINIGTLNLMQNAVEGSMRGRVMSMYTFLNQGAPAMGTLVIGVAAEGLGLPLPVIVGGVGTAVAGMFFLKYRQKMAATLETVPSRPSEPPPPTQSAVSGRGARSA